MLFESKEVRSERASGLSEVPKTPPIDKVNSKELRVEKLTSAGLCRRCVALVSWRTRRLFSDERGEFISTRNVRNMAFQFAIENCVSRPFSEQQRKAGWKCLRKFMRWRRQVIVYSSPLLLWQKTLQHFSTFLSLCRRILLINFSLQRNSAV
jgi:hypothetical protein